MYTDAEMFERNWRGRVKPCPHCRRRRWRALAGLAMAVSLVTGGGLAASSHPAPFHPGQQVTASSAVLASSTETLGGRILDRAERASGCWYSWAGAGPCSRGFDCSGLVVWAAAQLGVSLPHSTYSMLSSWHLVRVWYPQRGDLAFFGTGHVEFVTIWYHQTFGAHHSGTTVGWRYYDPRYYGPTAFYRIR